MSEEAKRQDQIILEWWSKELADRESAAARALAARLRRAGPVDALTEQAVHDLAQALGLRDGPALERLVRLLAEVREHEPGQSLAQRLGGKEQRLSALRFQRLMRADETELTDALRRAIVMADRCCDVASLGLDLLHWNDKTKNDWCFCYFKKEPPRNAVTEADA